MTIRLVPLSKVCHSPRARFYILISEELASIGQASRLATSIGLTREGVYKLPVAEEHGFRLTICVCYHMEKWASLCHGIPSNMVRSPEFNSIISGLTDVSGQVCYPLWYDERIAC